MFYPVKGVLGYTEMLFGTGVVYTISYGLRHDVQQYGGLSIRFALRGDWPGARRGRQLGGARRLRVLHAESSPAPFRRAESRRRSDAQQIVVDRPEFPGVPDALPSFRT